MERPFRDRRHAGAFLAARIQAYANRPNLLILALPRGGVPVAFEVAQALRAPLDLFLVRKLGVPGHEELAMGAIASGGVQVLNRDVVDMLHLSPADIDLVAARELQELERRENAYRGDRSPPALAHRTIILVDDGLATGASMRAAAEALRRRDVERIVVAVPVASSHTCAEIKNLVDDLVCAMTPTHFRAVGQWYQDFDQTSDDEVRDLLAQANRHAGNAVPSRSI